jgi:hypothetical protein
MSRQTLALSAMIQSSSGSRVFCLMMHCALLTKGQEGSQHHPQKLLGAPHPHGLGTGEDEVPHGELDSLEADAPAGGRCDLEAQLIQDAALARHPGAGGHHLKGIQRLRPL